MSNRVELPSQMVSTRLVVVLRASDTRFVDRVADTMVEGGATCLEVSFTVPDAPRHIERLANRHRGNAVIGAGTVLTQQQARHAASSGAEFLISPAWTEEVQTVSLDERLAYLPGAFTPTEVERAWRWGASAVKIFPAGHAGPRFLHALREPFPDVPMIPTGGISMDAADEWVRAGALAVGMGGSLVGDALRGGSLATLLQETKRLLRNLTAASR